MYRECYKCIIGIHRAKMMFCIWVWLALVLFTWDLSRDGSSVVPTVETWASRFTILASIRCTTASNCAGEPCRRSKMQ